MSKYVEKQLGREEEIIVKAKISFASIIWTLAYGLIGSILIIPFFVAVISLIQMYCMSLAVTNKRVVGKVGVLSTKTMDAPLNKVQNVSCSSGLIGKIFNYGTVTISTAAGQIAFAYVKSPETFKSKLSAQIDQYEVDMAKKQAEEMARAMAGVIGPKD